MPIVEEITQIIIPKTSKDILLREAGKDFLSGHDAKTSGAIFTPPWLAQKVTELAFLYYKKINPGNSMPHLIGDLSCGTGAFLYYLAKFGTSWSRVIGIDKNLQFVKIAQNIFKDDERVTIKCLDTLIDCKPDTRGKGLFVSAPSVLTDYDIIVGNPPYVRSQLLDSQYAEKLRRQYSDVVTGNFDLVIPFISHAIDSIASKGVCALVLSNKFMASRYGVNICKKLSSKVRILEIIDFGDNQIFPGRTTYTCVLIFSKINPKGTISVTKFPSSLDWVDPNKCFSFSEKLTISSEKLAQHPWHIANNSHEKVLELMRTPTLPKLMDIFPLVGQGLRTGANDIFVLASDIAAKLEPDIIKPLVTGENIKKQGIIASDKYILWPYEKDDFGNVVPINPSVFEDKYPKGWNYLNKHRDELSSRDLDKSIPWYGYSRVQNLALQGLPKILVKEMMPCSEFAADTNGQYVFSTGYAITSLGMQKEELILWAALLSTPTMEFQIRHCSTQLHSGWFRLLKEHLKRIHVFTLTAKPPKQLYEIAHKIKCHKVDDSDWKILDDYVATCFKIDSISKIIIKEHLSNLHTVSRPSLKKKIVDQDSLGTIKVIPHIAKTHMNDSFFPVKLSKYDKYHRERDDYRRLVTFQKNKTAPIHRWYHFTQGFSEELVRKLLRDFGASKKSYVYDPFCGTGTTLLSCIREEINSFGAEISPFLTWLVKLKTHPWGISKLDKLVTNVEQAKIKIVTHSNLLFQDYWNRAFAPSILGQILGWKKWIAEQSIDEDIKNFALLGLIGILEESSFIRKHGSHYRFLNNSDSSGILKLNIKVIESSAEIKPIFLKKIQGMVEDVKLCSLPQQKKLSKIYNIDSRYKYPTNITADFIITSPPYLNRNNYIAQQKAELSILGLLSSYEDYRKLVKTTFRSHVESELPNKAVSEIEEVNKIVSAINISEINNPKVPHMICGYFDDLRKTLKTIFPHFKKGGKLAFVVGNSRWGGIVVPVDHLLALIAEREGFKLESIYVTRLKGNSPQQMRKYGRIPLRESIVVFKK